MPLHAIGGTLASDQRPCARFACTRRLPYKVSMADLHPLDERLIGRTTHLVDLKGAKLRKGDFERCGLDFDGLDDLVPASTIGLPHWLGKRDVPRTVQLQHQSTADRVAGRAVVLLPVPRLTQCK